MPPETGVRAGAGGYGRPAPGFRLPAASRVGRVRLQVADLDRSLGFYAGILGFGILERGMGWVRLGGGAAPLIELRERPGARSVRARRLLGLYHFAVLLPDRPPLGRLYRRLREAGIALGAADHGVSEALYLQDPDGLGVEVYADLPRERWPVRGAELALVTEPLDSGSLIAAAGTAPWTGMPAGTTIGHIHLHTGDLEEARRFYHVGLGLDLVTWTYPGALFLSAGGYHHHLAVNTWAGPGAAPPGDEDARLLDWELVLPEPDHVSAAADHLAGAGWESRRGPGGVRVADPSGTALRLVSAGLP